MMHDEKMTVGSASQAILRCHSVLLNPQTRGKTARTAVASTNSKVNPSTNAAATSRELVWWQACRLQPTRLPLQSLFRYSSFGIRHSRFSG